MTVFVLFTNGKFDRYNDVTSVFQNKHSIEFVTPDFTRMFLLQNVESFKVTKQVQA